MEVKGAVQLAGDRVKRVAQVAARLERSRCILVYGGIERRIERCSVGSLEVDVHLWPLPEFLLTLSTCGADAEVLFE